MQRPVLRVVGACALGVATGCSADPKSRTDPGQHKLAVMMPMQGADHIAELEWGAHKVNRAGGMHGAELVVEYHPIDGFTVEQRVAEAQRLIDDPEVDAVLSGGGSDFLLELVPLFQDAGIPVLSSTDTAGELLRAFSGTNELWRTKLTDLIQVEFLLYELEEEGVQDVVLWTSLTHGGQTFFDWFAFYAIDQGFDPTRLAVTTMSTDAASCEAELSSLLELAPQVIVVSAATAAEVDCAVTALDAARDGSGNLPARVVMADLGLDVRADFSLLGDIPRGIEGWKGGSLEAETVLQAYVEHTGEPGLPWNGEAGHDTALLVAYGLARQEVTGGLLGDAIAEVVHGRETATGWDRPGVAEAIRLLEAGNLPDVSGATGPLTYDPLLNVDLVEGALVHWTWTEDADGVLGLVEDRSVVIGEGGAGVPRLHDEASEDAFEEEDELENEFQPGTPTPTAAKALIVTASAGWTNYRHQADALRRYQRLRDAGFSDADILMVGADDIVVNARNQLPGLVRNVPSGGDVYRSVAYDYDANVTGDMLTSILLGEVTADTPEVLSLDSGTNLYIYLVGHGGLFGVGFGAETAEAGYAGTGLSFWEPIQLTEALCTLRAADSVRRVFVEVETCHGGVYGDAEFWGIEYGCDGGTTPLEGVLVMTAANTLEVIVQPLCTSTARSTIAA